MKFVLLINLKSLTTANSFLLNIVEHENFSANKYENANYLLAEKLSCSAELSTKQVITSGSDSYDGQHEKKARIPYAVRATKLQIRLRIRSRYENTPI